MPNPMRVVNNTFQASLNREIDILFMVDNSSSMLPLQAKLLAQFPVFMNVLKMLPAGNGTGTALPDIHVAVVSSDTGPGQFDLPAYHCSFAGDRGEFQNAPRGTCTASPFKDPNQHFLSASMNQTVTNYNGDIADAFTCIAALGDQGCGFEGQLKSVRWALDPFNAAARRDERRVPAPRGVPRGHPDHQRGRLLGARRLGPGRPDADDHGVGARPAVVVALQRVRPPVPGRQRQPGSRPPRGPATNLQGCISNDTASGKLTKLSDEITFLKSLKTDPNQIFVAAITGPATPYSVEMIMQGNDTELHPNVVHSCMPSNDG